MSSKLLPQAELEAELARYEKLVVTRLEQGFVSFLVVVLAILATVPPATLIPLGLVYAYRVFSYQAARSHRLYLSLAVHIRAYVKKNHAAH